MARFLILARGESLDDAKMLAVSAEPEIVNHFIAVLSGQEVVLKREQDPGEGPQNKPRLEVVRGANE